MKRHEMCRPPDPSAVMLINEISKLFQDIVRTECGKFGMKSGYWNVLFHVAREDGMTQLDIVERSHFKAPTISVTLQKMELDGLIRREQDKDDQRQTRVYITEKGAELDMNIQKTLKKTDKKIMEGISVDDSKYMENILKIMRENVLKAVQN